MIITFTLQSTTDGSLLTGQASNTTVYISKDFGTYAQSTNSVTEIGRGEYKLELTTAESTYTTELHYQPVCSGAMTNTYAVGKDVTIPSDYAKSTEITALQNHGDSSWLTATGFSTFDPSSDTVTVNSTQANTFLTATGFATAGDITTALTSYGTCKTSDLSGISVTATVSTADKTDIAAKVWSYTPRTTTGDPDTDVVYCTQSQVCAHWTQTKVDSWVGSGGTTAIDNAIKWASRQIDTDLGSVSNTPFQPVPAGIRDLSILKTGIRLATLAGDTSNPDVQSAIAYYNKYIEDTVYST